MQELFRHLNFPLFTLNYLILAFKGGNKKYIIKYYCFSVGNLTALQTIGIPMRIDPAPFGANFISQNMTVIHRTFRFIDDLGALHGRVESQKKSHTKKFT